MKMNWGQKLVFFTIIFMVFIVTLVTIISRQKVDLVDANYYEKGIQYQDEIDKYAMNDSIKHEISFSSSQHQLSFYTNLPLIKGTVNFYRPSDSGLDFEIPFGVDENGIFTFSTQNLQKGTWKLTFEWTYEGKRMASEKQVVVE